jgi:D-alanyl-D-alanine carboxypeptidase
MAALLLVLLCAMPGEAWAIPDLWRMLEPHRERLGVPALGAVIVTRQDSMTALGVDGVRVADGDDMVALADAWHLGSITKSMTATVAARLAAQGLISFDSTVGGVLGARFPGMNAAYRNVTLRDLLGHRGGFTDDVTSLEVWERINVINDPPQDQRAAFLAEVLAHPPARRPGRGWLYSNAGYVVAGVMMEEAAGASWEELMARELFEPLKMASAGIGAPRGASGEAGGRDAPWGHRPGNPPQPVPPGPLADHPPALAPAGTVHMNLPDLAAYLREHLRGARGESDYLPGEYFTELHRRIGGRNYALGWYVPHASWAARRVLTHDGSNTLWYAVVWVAPDRDVAFAVTMNMVPENVNDVDDVIRDLVRFHFGR